MEKTSSRKATLPSSTAKETRGPPLDRVSTGLDPSLKTTLTSFGANSASSWDSISWSRSWARILGDVLMLTITGLAMSNALWAPSLELTSEIFASISSVARPFLPGGPLSPTPVVFGPGGLSPFLPCRRTWKRIETKIKIYDRMDMKTLPV